ncbi:hypothetical protein RFL03_10185 [Streptococcus parasuis]|uniref:hypothetical protein n=1 Tax=Streptococcus parasuis TaxID=1501662 RepID=UPI002FC814C3
MIESYYNVKQALEYIRQYPSGKEDIVPYINLTEKQLRDILKKDVLGTYKELPVGVHTQETYSNFEDNIVMDTLFVFPKYGDNPKILSSWDVIYKKEDAITKLMQRQGLKTEDEQIREEFKKSGKPAYLMNEDYLFSLKLEVERRQLPIKFIDIPLHTVSTIKSLVTENELQFHFEETIGRLLEEFQNNLQQDSQENHKLCIEQSNRLCELLGDVEGRNSILSSVAPEILSDEYLTKLEEMNGFCAMLHNNVIEVHLDIKNEVDKFRKVYKNNGDFNKLSLKLYDFEKYQLNKYKANAIEYNQMRIEKERNYKQYLLKEYKKIKDAEWQDSFINNLKDNFGLK